MEWIDLSNEYAGVVELYNPRDANMLCCSSRKHSQGARSPEQAADAFVSETRIMIRNEPIVS